MRREYRQLHSKLESFERRIDTLSNRFQDQIEELENKMHAKTSEQIRSLRNLNEVRFQIREGRLRDYYTNWDAEFLEGNIRRNTQDIRRISQRQQNLEDRISELGQPFPEGQLQNLNAGTREKKPNTCLKLG